jgi:hypothetical protein
MQKFAHVNLPNGKVSGFYKSPEYKKRNDFLSGRFGESGYRTVFCFWYADFTNRPDLQEMFYPGDSVNPDTELFFAFGIRILRIVRILKKCLSGRFGESGYRTIFCFWYSDFTNRPDFKEMFIRAIR